MLAASGLPEAPCASRSFTSMRAAIPPGNGIAGCCGEATGSSWTSFITTFSPRVSWTSSFSLSPVLTLSGSSATSGEPASMMMPRDPQRSATRAANVIPGRSRRSGSWRRMSAASTWSRGWTGISTLRMAEAAAGPASRPPGWHDRSRTQGSGAAVDHPGRMERGLYIAAAGMVAEMVRQDQVTNDLANASTPGYKADRSTQQSFNQMLLSNTLTGQPVGTLALGTRIDSVVTDLTQGPIRDTGEPLDFAVQGAGYFAVATPQGVQYTRNGQFALSPQGTLQTALGFQVLGQNGQAIRAGAGGRVNVNQ